MNPKNLTIKELCTIRDAFGDLDNFGLLPKEQSLTWNTIMQEIDSRIENKKIGEPLK